MADPATGLADLAEFSTNDRGRDARTHVATSRRFKTAILKLFIRLDLAAGNASRAALLPSVLRRGSQGLPTQRAITCYLEDLYGATFASGVLKFGESQVLVFRVEVISDRFARPGDGPLRRAATFLREMVTDPLLSEGGFRPDYLAQEKVNLQHAIESLRNDKGAYAAERCVQEMCRGEPYAVYEYGEVADIPAIEPRALRAFHDDLVRRNPLDAYLVSDLDVEEGHALLREALAFDRSGGAQLRGTTPNRPAPAEPREVVEDLDVQQAKLCIGFRSSRRFGDPGFYDLLVMNGVFGGFAHSKLFRHVREKAGLCYYASSHVERTKGLLFVQCGIESPNYAAARRLILEQLDAIRQGDVSDEELENTKRAFVHGYRAICDSPSRLVDVEYLKRLNGRVESVAESIARIQEVTRDGVVRAAHDVALDTVYLLRAANGSVPGVTSGTGMTAAGRRP